MSEQGRGRYDVMCEQALLLTNADAAALIVINGCRGHGFSVSFQVDKPGIATTKARMAMAYALRAAADDMEKGAVSS